MLMLLLGIIGNWLCIVDVNDWKFLLVFGVDVVDWLYCIIFGMVGIVLFL